MNRSIPITAAGTRTLDTGAPSRPPLKWVAPASVVAGLGMLLALFAGGLVLIPRYQAAHPPSALQRSDADVARLDDLYLDLTLATPAFLDSRRLGVYLGDRDPATVLPVIVGLNTHTGDIGHLHHLPGSFALVGPDGGRYPAVTEPIVLSQHHNAYMLLFPARDHTGARLLEQTGTLAVEAAGVGGRPVRRFEWQLPLPASLGGLDHGLASQLTLALALLGALLVVLSPCALELTLYYTAIISSAISDGEQEAARAVAGDPARAGRRRVLANLASFVVGFTVLYAAAGATVGLIGEGVREPLGDYGQIIQIAGGSLILFFAIRVAGFDRWAQTKLACAMPAASPATPLTISSSAGRKRSLVSRFHAWRARAQLRALSGRQLRSRDSFLAGLGLSASCLSCMGGAVLYPLLVYAGITSWYWGLLTLTLYSLGIAVPMLFIALGFFRIRLSLARSLGMTRGLRLASAGMLAAVSLLILTGNERIMTDVVFRLLAGVMS